MFGRYFYKKVKQQNYSHIYQKININSNVKTTKFDLEPSELYSTLKPKGDSLRCE
jgi:hypothetical protein